MTLVAALLVPLLLLGANAWLVRTEAGAALLVPGPRQVVQGFVTQLAARRGDKALDRLTEAARAETDADRLRAMADAFRQGHGSFRFEDGSEHRQGEDAEYRARIGTAERGVVERTFRLARDPRTRLWQIDRFQPFAEQRRASDDGVSPSATP